MRWTHLSHAMWLCEAGKQRLLFDPLLVETHHCGVYQTVPRRTLLLERLRPTAIFVSHRHPDHFDVPSLHALASSYGQVPLYTPDPLVIATARALGFRDVRSLVAPEVVELDGVRLTATLSLAKDEWGMLVATEDGAVWNQVDTVLRNADQVRAVASGAAARVGRPGIDLALVRWQPMLEVAAQLGMQVAFPLRTYADLLAQIVATGATAVVPNACGASHVGPFGWLDKVFYPVSQPRFLADLADYDADIDGFPARLGATYTLRGAETTYDPQGGLDLVASVDEAPDPRRYRPLSIPALADTNPNGHPESTTRPAVTAWIEQNLAPALHGRYPDFGIEAPLRFVLEVQFETVRDAFTLTVDASGCRLERSSDPEWEALVVIAGSLFWEVIEGRRSWGDVLLAGALRSQLRAYAPFNGQVRPLPIAAVFLYYALPYDRSVERAVAWDLQQALGAD